MPPGIRNRFTEFYVDEIDNPEDLKILVMAYLNDIAPNAPVDSLVNFYLAARREASTNLTGVLLKNTTWRHRFTDSFVQMEQTKDHTSVYVH